MLNFYDFYVLVWYILIKIMVLILRTMIYEYIMYISCRFKWNKIVDVNSELIAQFGVVVNINSQSGVQACLALGF